PANTIGWLLVGAGASVYAGLLSAGIVYATLDSPPAYWQRVLAWFANIAFLAGLDALLVSLGFLFPTGRPISRRWGSVARLVVLALIVNYCLFIVQPGPLSRYFADTPQLTNPFGIAVLGELFDRLAFLSGPLWVGVILASLAAMVARLRGARGIERLQLQWIALVIGLVGVMILLTVVLFSVLPEELHWLPWITETLFFAGATYGLAAAIGVAILRYHLYDLGRIVNRTIVYLALSVSLALMYVALILGLGGLMRALTGASGSGVTAVATLLAAALFRPLRLRIQHIVDRRFYRRKYDAARMVADFAVRVRDEVELASVEAELCRLVGQTMQPAHVSVWLRPTASTPLQ
ncbi:MAG: hypothetical protein DCC58_12325, partial [Chloroflexi bacterium]